MMTRVVLIEADDGLRTIHSQYLNDVPGFATLTSGRTLLQALDQLRDPTTPDVLIINISSNPDARAREWPAIRFLFAECAVLGLYGKLEDIHLLQALQAGVVNFCKVSSCCSDFVWAIGRAHQKLRCYDDNLGRRIRSLLSYELRTPTGVGCLRLDPASGRSTFRGQDLGLSHHEFRALMYLVSHRGRTIGSDELFESVWGMDEKQGATDDQLKSCIKRIRRKMERGSTCPRYVRSMRGYGYFVPDELGPNCQECPAAHVERTPD